MNYVKMSFYHMKLLVFFIFILWALGGEYFKLWILGVCEIIIAKVVKCLDSCF